MKAILLAAGRGTRISKRIKEIPKCTLPIGDKPLIRRTVEMMLSVGIEPIVCVGYKHEKIYEALEGLPVKFFYNPFYDVTNSLASLWFARNELDDDLIVMNADVFFSLDILNRMLEDKRPVVMASDKSRTATGDYFFALGENNCIQKYGKDIPLEERSCEYVGLAKVSKSFLPEFTQRLDEMIGQQKHGCWWEEILYSFSDEKDIHTLDIDGMFWSEIDYFDDYQRILNYIDITENKK
jgi:choline kinase